MNGKCIVVKGQTISLILLMTAGLLSGIVLNPGFNELDSQPEFDSSDGNPLESEKRGTRSNGDVDYIVIVDSEGTGFNEITNQTVYLGFSIQGWAAGFNNTDGYIADIPVNWSVSNTTSTASTSPLNGTNSTFDADITPGTAIWTADDGVGHSDTVVFTITNITVDYIVIVDTPNSGTTEILDQTVPVGFTITGWAAAFNDTQGYIGDISVDWSVNNVSSTATTDPPTGTSSTFDADNNSGQATWIADDGAGHLDQILFTITTPTIDYITIVDSGGSGATEIPDQAVPVEFTIQGWAAAFNSSVGYIGDVSVTWTVDNTGSGATTNPGFSNTSTFDAGATEGIANWTAVDAFGHNDTVSFNIIAPAIDYIMIVDTEGTGVGEIPDQTVSFSFTVQGWAAAFNNSVGYIGDIPVTWNVTNTSSSASTSPVFGTNSTFDADVNPGTAVWMADDGTGHNDTVVFTIETPVLDYILIVDTADTGAMEIPDQTVDAGFTITGYAATFNYSAGYMGDVSVVWTVDNISSSASTSPSSGTNSTFDAGSSGGSATWTAEDGMGHSDVVNFTINPPTIDYITIVNSSGSGAAEIPDQTVDVGFTIPGWAAAYNTSVGYMGEISVTWTVDNMSGANAQTTPAVGVTSTFDAGDSGGNATWTADDGFGHNDTVEFTINPPLVDYIVIVDSAGSGTNEISDQTVPFNFTLQGWAAAFNNSVGYLGDISVTWSVSNTTSTATTNPLSGTNSIFDADVNTGTATWMADDGAGHNDTVEFYITDYTVDYILIVDTADAGLTEIPDQTVGVGFTIEGWAAAFNYSVGHVGDVSVLWTVVNFGGANASTSPSTGTNSTFNAGGAGGTATWTAEDGLGHSDVVNFTINPPTIDYITIVDSGGSGTTEIPDQAVPVEFTIQGWAAAFNTTAGYLGDTSVTWTVDNFGGANAQTIPAGGITSTFDAGDSAGSATWTAEDSLGHTDTVEFTINPPTMDYIIIVDSADSGTNEVSDQIVPVGFTVDGWAAAFNDSIGYIFDISVLWYVGNSGGSTAFTNPSSGTSSTFNANVNTGTATWTADDGAGHIDTVIFTITDITVDYIVIVDTPNSGTTEIPDQSVPVGFTITGWAAAFNDTQGYIGDISVDWSVNNVSSTATTNPSTGTSSTFDAGNNAGQATWIADDGAGHTDDVIFTIMTPTPDYIVIVDSGLTGASEIPDQSVGVGFTIQGWAAAFNTTAGYMGDVLATWSVVNSGGATASTTPSTGTNSQFNANMDPGSATWEADDGAGHNDTVDFTILPPTADYILIVSSPGTGTSEIADQTVDVGFTITGYAAAFNDTVGYYQDIAVTWSVANVGSNASTSPSSGTSSAFYSGWQGGTCNWTADDGSGHTDYVLFTVNAPAVDYILIVDSEDAGSDEIIDMGVNIGYSLWGWAASFNDTIGYIGDVSVSWLVGNAGSNATSAPASGTNSTFYSGWFGGTATWTASDGSGHSDSVIFTVNPPQIDYILIMDAPDGGGSEIPDKIIDVGETHRGWAAGFNSTAGYVGDISVTWNVGNTGSSASTSPLSGTNSSFYAGIVEGSAILTADDGQGHTDTVVFTINPPTVDYISIRDAPDGGGNVIDDPSYPVGAQIRFYAVLFNVTSGFIANAPNTTVWDSDDEAIISLTSPGEFTDIQCSDQEHGTVLISVDDQNGHTNSTMVTVLEPTVDELRIMDAPGSGGSEISNMLYPVGAEDNYYGVMFNDTAGYLGNVPNSATWSSNRPRVEVTSPGSSTEITCSDTDYGKARVTLKDGQGHMVWVDVEILPPTMDYIQLQDDSGSQGNILEDHAIAGGAFETYFAVAYNDTAGYIGAVDVDWLSTNPGVGSLSDSSGSHTTFTASSSMMGTTTITVGYQGNLTGSFVVTVNDEADPVADAGSDQTVKAGEIVQFDGTGSEDNVGIESYEWTFSDGDNTLTLDGDKVEYTFEEPGTYEITLEVTDTSGNGDMDSLIVIVEGKDGDGDTGFNWLLLIIPIIVVIIVLLLVFLLLKKRKVKSICNVCGRDFYPQTDEEAASGVCPVCKAKEAVPEPVEAIVEEVAPVEDEETIEPASVAPVEDEETAEPVSAATEEALLQTVQCSECAHEFSAKSKTPGLMAVTCPNCGTKGEIEF